MQLGLFLNFLFYSNSPFGEETISATNVLRRQRRAGAGIWAHGWEGEGKTKQDATGLHSAPLALLSGTWPRPPEGLQPTLAFC